MTNLRTKIIRKANLPFARKEKDQQMLLQLPLFVLVMVMFQIVVVWIHQAVLWRDSIDSLTDCSLDCFVAFAKLDPHFHWQESLPNISIRENTYLIENTCSYLNGYDWNIGISFNHMNVHIEWSRTWKRLNNRIEIVAVNTRIPIICEIHFEFVAIEIEFNRT